MSKNLKTILALLLILIAAFLTVFFIGRNHYKTHFLPDTFVNGISAGGKTAEEVRYDLQDKIREYTLTIRERGGKSEVLTGSQLYMQYVDDGSVGKLLAGQNPSLWIVPFGKIHNLQVSAGFTYDKNTLTGLIDQLEAFRETNITKPEGAEIEYENGAYVVKEAVQGNEPDREAVGSAIENAIQSGETEIDLDAEGLYKEAEGTADNSELQKTCDTLNKMISAKVTYDFSDRTMTVDADTIRGWIVQDDEGNYSLDEDKAKEWVVNMAKETDTFGLAHDFTTSSGKQIRLEYGGDYGWLINRDATTEQLLEAVRNGGEQTLEPVYRYKGADRSANDIGDTYVEINITAQTMWCYKDGQLVVSTPVVTGNESRGWNTPSGCVWAVDAKEYKATFENAGNVKVDYWLPFNGNCGIHDASWRTEYGGQIYKTNGSHGCINTPHDAAGKIFEAMEIGYPVIVYYSEDQVKGPGPTGEITAG